MSSPLMPFHAPVHTMVGIKATVLPWARIEREYRRMSSLPVNTRGSAILIK